MLVSVIIPTYNEGEYLTRTVRTCQGASSDVKTEIIVVDDASTDGSADDVGKRFPFVRLFRNTERQGVAATKDFGARHANGSILLFVDAHCNLERNVIARLAGDVCELGSKAIVTPRLVPLDCQTWENDTAVSGTGYLLDLETFEERWVPLAELRRKGRFYESPNVAGTFAVPAEVYHDLRGFDCAMRGWGCENVDFGLKTWLLGYEIVNDFDAVIGHRFRPADHFAAPMARILANQIRMAWKHFRPYEFTCWLHRCTLRNMPDVSGEARKLFDADKHTAEQERQWLVAKRKHDVDWYSFEFDLEWPFATKAQFTPEAWLATHGVPATRLVVNANAVGKSSSEEGNLTVILRIGKRATGDQDIEQATFYWSGDERVAASTACLLRIIEGRTIRHALSIQPGQIARHFVAEPMSLVAATISVAALHNALQFARSRND